jgi:hypothetical protein
MDEQVRPVPAADGADDVATVSSDGDPDRASRWKRVRRIASVAALVLAVAAKVEQDNVGVALALLVGAGCAFALAFWATYRQRHDTPTPSIVGAELARYKAVVVKPGGNGRGIWLVLSEEGIYLLGRGTTVDSRVLRYSEVFCAQRFQLRMLAKKMRTLVRLLSNDDSSCSLSTRRRDADSILDVLGAHGVLTHAETPSVEAIGFAFGFGTGKLFETAQHDSCRTRSPQWVADPLQRHEHRYWDGASWTNYVSDHGHVTTEESSA